MKNRFILLVAASTILGIPAIQGCKSRTDKTKSENIIDPPSAAPGFHKVLSLQNISFEIKSSARGSIQKLTIQPIGLSMDNRELVHQIDGRIMDAEIEDLNSDGYPEIVIYTQSAGSGSYGDVIAYSVNNGKSLSQVYFPPLSENPEAGEGYMGHDEFTLIETSLAQRFPLYKAGDPNSDPSGGMRQVEYKLVEGEASRRFIIDRITDYPPR